MNKEPISIRLDRDVLAFFKGNFPRYQTKINAILREFTQATSRKKVTRKQRRF